MRILSLFWLVSIITLLIMFGCVKVPCPDSAILNARKAIEDAKAQEADLYVPDNYGLAVKELSRAQKELVEGSTARALGWARRSAADAELAEQLARVRKFKGGSEKSVK